MRQNDIKINEYNQIEIELTEYNPILFKELTQLDGFEYHRMFRKVIVSNTETNKQRLTNIGLGTSNIMEQQQKKYNDVYSYLMQKFGFLYEHQTQAAVLCVLNKRYGVFDEMGLGKTVTSLAAMFYQMDEGVFTRLVIICPKSIKQQWRDEIQQFFGRGSVVLDGTPKQRQVILNAEPNVVIINYEQVTPELLDWLRTDKYGVIIDEASYLKNDTAKRTRNVRAMKPSSLIVLTGTPYVNNLRDFYNIGLLINHNWLPSYVFNKDHCVFEEKYLGRSIGYKTVCTGYKNFDLFKTRATVLGVRRTKTDVKQMPPKIYYKREIQPGKQQQRAMSVVEKYLKRLNDEPQQLAASVLLNLISDSTELLHDSSSVLVTELGIRDTPTDSAKLTELKHVLDELPENDKVVVFTRFKKMAYIIFNALKDDYSCVTGTGDNKDKHEVVQAFKAKHKLFICTDAFAYGVDMPFAQAVVHFDLNWSPATMKQREDRVYRITTTESPKIFYLVSHGYEEYMYQRVYNKISQSEFMADITPTDKVGYFNKKEK